MIVMLLLYTLEFRLLAQKVQDGSSCWSGFLSSSKELSRKWRFSIIIKFCYSCQGYGFWNFLHWALASMLVLTHETLLAEEYLNFFSHYLLLDSFLWLSLSLAFGSCKSSFFPAFSFSVSGCNISHVTDCGFKLKFQFNPFLHLFWETVHWSYACLCGVPSSIDGY